MSRGLNRDGQGPLQFCHGKTDRVLISVGSGMSPPPRGWLLAHWAHPGLWVCCLSAAVYVTDACHIGGIKNNPVANSISQNNCLQSALLGRMATKIRFPGMVCWGWWYVISKSLPFLFKVRATIHILCSVVPPVLGDVPEQ